MDGYIVASVFRYNPETDSEPYYDEYKVEAAHDMSVLVLLNEIQKNIDNTLGFRSYSCGLQMCRSCLMKINHKKQFACLTMIKPGEKVVIEPVTYPELHIRALVVKIKEKESAR